MFKHIINEKWEKCPKTGKNIEYIESVVAINTLRFWIPISKKKKLVRVWD